MQNSPHSLPWTGILKIALVAFLLQYLSNDFQEREKRAPISTVGTFEEHGSSGVIAIHAVVMPNGELRGVYSIGNVFLSSRIMAKSDRGTSGLTAVGGTNKFRISGEYDPTTFKSEGYLQNSDSWCANGFLAPDGRVFSVGGFTARTTSGFDATKGLRIWY